jgi:hypothetical protein
MKQPAPIMTPRRVDLAAAAALAALGLACVWQAFAAIPHPTWALASAVSFVGAVIALKG